MGLDIMMPRDDNEVLGHRCQDSLLKISSHLNATISCFAKSILTQQIIVFGAKVSHKILH